MWFIEKEKRRMREARHSCLSAFFQKQMMSRQSDVVLKDDLMLIVKELLMTNREKNHTYLLMIADN